MLQRQGYFHPLKQIGVMKTFLITLILMTQISIYLFSLVEIIENYIIAITPKLVKKVAINFDSSKLPGPDCIPVIVQKNCEPELLYILA